MANGQSGIELELVQRWQLRILAGRRKTGFLGFLLGGELACSRRRIRFSPSIGSLILAGFHIHF